MDLPTVLESTYVTNMLSKMLFTFVYLVIYGVRPLVVRPKAASERAGWLLHACAWRAGRGRLAGGHQGVVAVCASVEGGGGRSACARGALAASI